MVPGFGEGEGDDGPCITALGACFPNWVRVAGGRERSSASLSAGSRAAQPAHCTVFPGLVLCLAVTACTGRSWRVEGREGGGGGAEAAHSGYQGDAAELGPALASQASRPKTE